jgi:hypothetical protein
MAGDTLMGDGARLDGAVIEAGYAADRPPLLKRLADDRVPRLIDPQTVRFAGARFLQVPKLAELTYAPDKPITPDEMNAAHSYELARGALAFAQDRGTERNDQTPAGRRARGRRFAPAALRATSAPRPPRSQPGRYSPANRVHAAIPGASCHITRISNTPISRSPPSTCAGSTTPRSFTPSTNDPLR